MTIAAKIRSRLALKSRWRRLFKKPKLPGSAVEPRKSIRRLRDLRRVSQAAFLLLFCYLIVETTFRGSFASSSDPVRVALPVEGYLFANPYVALMTFLATHTVYRGLLWSVGVVALTLVVGRVFCGWMCPFGTLHHLIAWLWPSRALRGARSIDQNKTHVVRQRVKYYLLFATLGAALTGSAVGGIFDPICIAVRSISMVVLPASQYAASVASDAASASNVRPLQDASDVVSDFLASALWQSGQVYFHESWFIGALFVAALFINRFIPRFWCRVLCPLGALLGLTARFSLFGMEKSHEKCTDCDLCLVHCQGADSPQGGVKWRQDECHMCLNCEVACPEDVIKFRFLPNRLSQTREPDTGRRTAVASALAGVFAVPMARAAGTLDANYNERVIRPPGALPEREFLERCIRCAECMKVCPNNALHPAALEAGIEGLWTPILIPRIGYCEHSCVLCGDVCPTGAIQKISEEQKLGIDQKPISMGTAFFDRGRCLPWGMATPCIVCEEFCPTSPKAIWVEAAEVPKRELEAAGDDQGHSSKLGTVNVQRPHLDPTLCIGCGACEKACPVQDDPAVYVTNVGETRSRTNVILLEGHDYNRS